MKKLFAIMILAALFMACDKDHTVMPATQAGKITGKWRIITVTVIPLDSTGKAKDNGNIIPEPSSYYFEFDADSTWTETLTSDPDANIGEHGIYKMHGDSSFTLINTNATEKAVECRIVTLTSASFTFKFQRATKFNGITPGWLQTIFQLEK